ncbi:MAG: N-acetyl-gamma-glutamyl-phosphate reductase [Burkholderiaceae bacterium]
MTHTVFIDGDQGTTGIELLSRLQHRADISLARLPPDRRRDADLRADAINSCDIAILCLPDPAARDAARSIRNPRVRVLDASSAHRTASGWVYGLPELTPAQPELIAGASRVSNPGCYPSGAILLLRPLIAARLVAADARLAIHAVSGYSGRGRVAVEAIEAAGESSPPDLTLYSLGLAHKHLPEITRLSGLRHEPLFVPAYGSFRQGIALTIAVQPDQVLPGTDTETLRRCLSDAYSDQRLVRVRTDHRRDDASELSATALNGSDEIELSVFAAASSGPWLLAAVFDNLGKGAAGAAVQNLDLMLGRPSVVHADRARDISTPAADSSP